MNKQIEKMIQDRTTALTADLLTGKHDSPEQIRKAIRHFNKDKKKGKKEGKAKPSNEPL